MKACKSELAKRLLQTPEGRQAIRNAMANNLNWTFRVTLDGKERTYRISTMPTRPEK